MLATSKRCPLPQQKLAEGGKCWLLVLSGLAGGGGDANWAAASGEHKKASQQHHQPKTKLALINLRLNANNPLKSSFQHTTDHTISNDTTTERSSAYVA